MPPTAPAEEHVTELLAELRETRAALSDEYPGARFLAFWDLDGTLLHGDCSEGLSQLGRPVYAGLVQLAVERGLAPDYPPDAGYFTLRDDYRLLKERFGRWLAYPFLAQVFAGTLERDLVELSTAHFSGVLANYFFASSRRIFEELAADGVEQHVLSASADVFVRGAAAALRIAPAQLHGIRVRIEEGRLTRDLVAPVTVGDGKRARLVEIVRQTATAARGRRVFVLAGFGNCYVTDGAFLTYIVRNPLPCGVPVSVVVNGGVAPVEYRRLFRSVRHVRTVGA